MIKVVGAVTEKEAAFFVPKEARVKRWLAMGIPWG